MENNISEDSIRDRTGDISRKRSLVQVQYRPPSQKQHRFEATDLDQVLSLLLSANPDLAKQLRLKQLDNETLFNTYFDELKFRQLSPYYTNQVKDLLLKFKDCSPFRSFTAKSKYPFCLGGFILYYDPMPWCQNKDSMAHGCETNIFI